MSINLTALDALLKPKAPSRSASASMMAATLRGALPYDAIKALDLGMLSAPLIGAIEVVRADPRWGSVFRGDLTAYAGDHSAADLAMCGEFARLGLTGPAIDAAMRSSGLYRDKWERDDYRQRTIGLATGNRQDAAGKSSSATSLAPENGRIDASTNPPPPREWLVDGVLHTRKSAVLAGLSGLSKTQLTLQLCMHVAIGKPFAGRSTKRGKALFLSGEEDRAEMQRRVNAVIRHANLPQAEIDLVRANMFAYPLVGEDIRLTKPGPNGLRETKFAEDVIAAADHHEGVRLIVIDHAGLVHGGDFNAKQDAAQTMRVVNDIAERTGAVVLLLAHSPKSASQAEEPDASLVFGSTAFVEQARGGWIMTIMTKAQASQYGIGDAERTSYVALTGVKANYTPQGQEFWFKRIGFDEVGLLEHVTLQPPAGKSTSRYTLAAKILEEVRGSPGRYSKTKLRDQFQGKSKGPWKATKAEIESAVEELLEAGQLMNRAPSVEDRKKYDHGSQVRQVLDVASNARGTAS